jgi:hypothetical protein
MEINDGRDCLMDTLNKEQRDILLDYYFECADLRESNMAKDLLETHQGAMEFYNRLHHSLSPLEHLDHETFANCPDHLVEKTLERLYAHNTETSNIRLEKLLRAESEKPVSYPIVTKQAGFWRSFAEAAAVAAGVFILASLFVPVTRQMRAQASKTACQANLSTVSRGITQYGNEHNDFLPAVATKAGSPWWKIGSTGPENQSNTRHLWLLVKQGYLQPKDFVCPGRSKEKSLDLNLSQAQIAQLFDFSDRQYITYSFKLICDPNKAVRSRTKTPLMADINPLFESCFKIKNPDSLSKSEFEPVTLSKKLLTANSSSHRSKGQNILFSDGTVEFTSQRVFGQDDDIFTVKGQDTYRGTEKPSCDTDVFLVP